MYHPVLRSGAQLKLKRIGQADLVIGLPTYKNPKTAAYVARMALAGAHQYYPDLRTVLINADAGYKAGTRRAVIDQAYSNGANGMVVAGRYEGVRGRGSAVAALLDAALALDAKAIIILDSNTHSVTPKWTAGLAHLIFQNKVDLVLPRYQWSPSSPHAVLNDLVAYPLFRALWGRSVRHPVAPDFALSPQLATAILDKDIWETEVATFGLSPWLATYAVLGNWRVAQSALGEKRTSAEPVKMPRHLDEKGQIKRIMATFKTHFHDVISVMLRQVYNYRNYWRDVKSFHSLSTLTQFVSVVESVTAPEQDPAPLLDSLVLGWIEHRALWQTILTADNLSLLEALASLPPDRFYFPPDLWARIIFDFAVVFNKGECDPYQVVDSFYPIYQGRLAAFRQEIAGLSFVAREGTVAAQAVELEETRPYFKVRWHTYQSWLHDDE